MRAVTLQFHELHSHYNEKGIDKRNNSFHRGQFSPCLQAKGSRTLLNTGLARGKIINH